MTTLFPPQFVDVLVPVALDQAYSYRVPPGLDLKPGDIVIQVGAWHKWSCPRIGSIMVFDMISAGFPDGPVGLAQNNAPVVSAKDLKLPDGVKPARRIVTIDKEPGKSCLVSDGPAPDVRFPSETLQDELQVLARVIREAELPFTIERENRDVDFLHLREPAEPLERDPTALVRSGRIQDSDAQRWRDPD